MMRDSSRSRPHGRARRSTRRPRFRSVITLVTVPAGRLRPRPSPCRCRPRPMPPPPLATRPPWWSGLTVGGAVGARPPRPAPGSGDTRRGLRAGALRVDRGRAADDVVVDPILREGGRRLLSVEARDVRLVLAEEQLGCDPTGPVPTTSSYAPSSGWSATIVEASGTSRTIGRSAGSGFQDHRAEPQGRQHVDRIGLGAPVSDRDPHEHVVGIAFA